MTGSLHSYSLPPSLHAARRSQRQRTPLPQPEPCLDPEQASALELAGAYQQRWEHELALREIETQLLEPGGGLRSKTPELVRQELWGLLLTHYAIRALMVEAADIGEIDPDRLSFLRTLNIVRRQVIDQAGFSPRHDETGNDPRHR